MKVRPPICAEQVQRYYQIGPHVEARQITSVLPVAASADRLATCLHFLRIRSLEFKPFLHFRRYSLVHGQAEFPARPEDLRKIVTNHKDPSADESPPCRKCRKPMQYHVEDTPLDRFGQFVRLSCNEPHCGHVDWYKEAEFKSVAAGFSVAGSPGEVWVHDIILGLSFKQTDDRV